MSYQVLARKWRPQFFKDMVGQEHVLRALINALDNQRLHHAYLFTGTRGVGKTTIARILAKCLNCEQGISSEPCGECQSCQEISQGRFVDLIEVDAASRTKVEDTREILDNVQYAPTRGRFKVYLIDEVHMLSNSSFNALLKTLEEPPPHVKFLLATTDPQKLPATILSRCLQFSLKNMTPERIVGYLKSILGQESISAEEPGLWLLGRAAEGSMRDALSLTDQAISFGEGQIKEHDVAAMLGTVDRGRVFQLAIALAEANAADALGLVAQMAEHAVDFNNLLADLISLIHRIALAQAVPEAVDNSQGDKEQVMALAQAVSPSMVQLMYQIALTGKRDLPLAPDPRSGMEMTLLRMINFAPVGQQAEQQSSQSGVPPVKKPDLAHLKRQVVSAPQVSEPSDVSVPPISLDSTDSSATEVASDAHLAAVTPATEALSSATETAPEVIADVATDVDMLEPSDAVSVGQAQSTVEAIDESQESPPWEESSHPVSFAPQTEHEQQVTAHHSTPEVPLEPEAPAPQATFEQDIPVAAAPSADFADEGLPEDIKNMPLSGASWPLVFEHLPVDGMLRNLVANTCLVSVDGALLTFHGEAGHMRLFSAAHQKKFNELLNEALGSQYQLTVVDGPLTHETPAQRAQRLAAERQQAAITSIEQDPNVQALRQAFNAQVIMDSITPI